MNFNKFLGSLLVILLVLLSPFILLVAFIIDIPKIIWEVITRDKNKQKLSK